MTQTHPERSCLLQVGLEIFPIYGDPEYGWCVDYQSLCRGEAHRYKSLDEVFFVLVNFIVTPEGNC